MSEDTPPVRYMCVVASPGRRGTCTDFATPDALVTHLRQLYAETLESRDPDVRVFVFAGSRLLIDGAPVRTVTFPDGTRAVISPERTEVATDYLLSVIDRVWPEPS